MANANNLLPPEYTGSRDTRFSEVPSAAARTSSRRLTRQSVVEAHTQFVKSLCPARTMFAVMSAFMFCIVYGMNVALSVTIIAMVNNTAVAGNVTKKQVGGCPPSSEAMPDGPFIWNTQVRGVLLSSYFFGYLVTPVAGGILAERYSAKWLIFAAVVLNMVACVLIPPMATSVGWGAVVAMRILEGMGGGVTFPAMHVMLSKWAPPEQRSIFAGIVYAGTAIGTVASILLGGFASVAIGWPWVFYILAIVCLPWLLLWGMWVHDSPRRAIFITHDERISILRAHKGTRKEEAPHFPYKSVFTSTAFWAVLVGHVGGNCGLYMCITQTPTFLKSVLHIPMKTLTSLSAVPYVFMYIFSVVAGLILDSFRKTKGLSTANARKIAAAITMLVPAIMLIILSNVGCNWQLAVSVMTVAVACIGAQSCAYLANHIDIAPNFAGILMGITNTAATVPGIIIPAVIGILTQDEQTIARWRIMFYGICGVELVCFLFFLVYARGEVQSWNEGDKMERRFSEMT